MKTTIAEAGVDAAPVFLRPEWPAPARVSAAVSTRLGGYSRGAYASLNLGAHCGDDPAAVVANRRCVADTLPLPKQPAWLRQVHGNRVVPASVIAPDVDGPEADGSWSGVSGEVCVVMMADCLPVLFCDVGGTVVAAAHAGWRGLAGGILEATVSALPVPPQQVLAWLGPAIGPGAFEVGAEVRTAFVERHAQAQAAFRPGRRADSYFADLYALARMRLNVAGVDHVYGGGLCTHADAQRFFSYRRDGVTGRMAAMIWLSHC